MTSVLGHLTNMDYPCEYGNWRATPLEDLFHVPIDRHVVSSDNKSVLKNIESEAKQADWLIIWTDCDREGEAIGYNVATCCKKVNPTLQVYRARFSAVTKRDLSDSMKKLGRLDEYQAQAVFTRQELDLRTGVIFTRFLTLRYGSSPLVAHKKSDVSLISYGPCQFPTLGFVVEQYLKRKNFISEPFWYLLLEIIKDDQTISFNWNRKSLFDPLIVLVLYEQTLSNISTAAISNIINKPTSKWKPYPLTTVDMQKFVSNYFKISSHRLMQIAETLYNRGYISYPRTETSQFPRDFDFNTLIQHQINHSKWGSYAQKLLNSSLSNDMTVFCQPRQGKSNDQAHPPIHPTSPGVDLEGDEATIYEFITRRFLACCSLDAKGNSTTIECQIGQEKFHTNGSIVTDIGYLEVYVYDKWSDKSLPHFSLGEMINPNRLDMKQGHTTAPQLLSEADLISTMDANGIGTDATIHDHIQTIIDRGYVIRRKSDRRFEPSELGIALIIGFDKIGLTMASLSKPSLRKQMEQNMKAISEQRKQSQTVLKETIELYYMAFQTLSSNISNLDDTMCHNSNHTQLDNGTVSNNSNNSQSPNCYCNIKAIRRKVAKTGSNQGRYFYVCTKEKENQCKFFQWDDSEDKVNDTIDNGKKCECNLDAKIGIVQDGPNKGREYATCIKATYRCSYWEWLDGKPNMKEPNIKKKTLGIRKGKSNG